MTIELAVRLVIQADGHFTAGEMGNKPECGKAWQARARWFAIEAIRSRGVGWFPISITQIQIWVLNAAGFSRAEIAAMFDVDLMDINRRMLAAWAMINISPHRDEVVDALTVLCAACGRARFEDRGGELIWIGGPRNLLLREMVAEGAA